MELEKNLVEDSRRSNSNKMRDIFLGTASEEPTQDLESSCEEYDNNRRSNHAKRADERIKQIRELLVTKSKRSFGKLTAEQASLVRAASHYWLDKDITNGHLLICDWCFRILKGSKMRSLDSDKRCC